MHKDVCAKNLLCIFPVNLFLPINDYPPVVYFLSHENNSVDLITMGPSVTTATVYAVLLDTFGNFISLATDVVWQSRDTTIARVVVGGKYGEGSITRYSLENGFAWIVAYQSGFPVDSVFISCTNNQSPVLDPGRYSNRQPTAFVTLCIYNVLGRRLYQGSINQDRIDKTVFSVIHRQPGVYFSRIMGKNANATRKFVITK